MGKMRGRPRKNTETLKITGAYREDRHGARRDDTVAKKRLRKPEELQGESARCWSMTVGSLPAGVFNDSDFPLLIAFCNIWAKYVEAREENSVSAMLKLADQLTRMACRLGLTPTDRSRLNIPEAPKEAGIKSRTRA